MMNESAVQSHVRLEMAKFGPVWRNNVGAAKNINGRLIRYGLGNDSAQINCVIKSSDLIGITPVRAYVDGIGWTILGVFTAVECKASNWILKSNDERAMAQMKFHDIVKNVGGFAGFVSDPAHVSMIKTFRNG